MEKVQYKCNTLLFTFFFCANAKWSVPTNFNHDCTASSLSGVGWLVSSPPSQSSGGRDRQIDILQQKTKYRTQSYLLYLCYWIEQQATWHWTKDEGTK